jgi:hypothetical protein
MGATLRDTPAEKPRHGTKNIITLIGMIVRSRVFIRFTNLENEDSWVVIDRRQGAVKVNVAVREKVPVLYVHKFESLNVKFPCLVGFTFPVPCAAVCATSLLIVPATNPVPVTVQVTFEIGIEELRSPAAKTVSLQLFVPLFLTLTLILTGLGVPTMEGCESGFASANESVVSRMLRLTVT